MYVTPPGMILAHRCLFRAGLSDAVGRDASIGLPCDGSKGLAGEGYTQDTHGGGLGIRVYQLCYITLLCSVPECHGPMCYVKHAQGN